MRRQVPEHTRRPNGQGRPREGRKAAQVDGRELRSLVKRWKGHQKTLSLKQALSGKHISQKQNGAPDLVVHDPEVVDYIPNVRVAVSQHPRLAMGSTKPLPNSSERAKKEQRRRDGERTLFEELSRYYQLDSESRQVEWERPSLLKEGKRMPNTSPRERHSTNLRTSSSGGSQGSASSSGTCQRASSLNFGAYKVLFGIHSKHADRCGNYLTVYFWSSIHEFLGLVSACAGR